MGDSEIDVLIHKIRQVFSKTRKPSTSRISRDNDELKGIIGKKWTDLTVDDVNHYSYMGFLTREALRYYLPAYLTKALEHPDQMENSIGIIVVLSPETNAGWKDQQTVGADFTNEEKAVILEFFEIYRHLYPIPDEFVQHRIYKEEQQLLERGIRYWQQSLDR